MNISIISNETAETFLLNNFSSPTHWPDWNIIIAKYYNSNFFYLGMFDNDKLIGIYPVHEVKKKFNLLTIWHSGHFKLIPNGGWIFNKYKKFNIKQLPSKMNLMHSCFGLPLIEEFNTSYSDKIENFNSTLILNLENDLDEIWEKNISSKRRNMIRKAQKNGIQIKVAKDENDLKEFYKIYSEALERLGLKTMPLEIFFDLFFLSKNIKLVVIMAFKDAKQLSNVVIVQDKNYSYYWLGNSGNNIKNDGQGELLQWEAIKMMKSAGCSYYDLCYIDPEKLPYIYRFKKGFCENEIEVPVILKKSLYYKIMNRILNDSNR